MTTSHAWRTFGVRALVAVAALHGGAGACAQNPPLAPTSDITIVVNSSLHYSSILVPLGVTVRFVAPGFGPGSMPGMPAVVRCDGDAIVHGTLWLAGDIINDRPAGWVTTGRGAAGNSCAGNFSFPFDSPPTGGLHAGTYGTVLPFSLEGGSPGGTLFRYSDRLCTQFASAVDGGEGGGTLVLLAGGRIQVDGTITADGSGYLGVGGSAGSGGSILLSGRSGVSVLPGSSITAKGGVGPPAPRRGPHSGASARPATSASTPGAPRRSSRAPWTRFPPPSNCRTCARRLLRASAHRGNAKC